MSDEQKREALVKRLEPFLDEQDCYSPPPLLPLEMFFEGNDDEGSIGCNLVDHPGIAAFYESLLKLRDEKGVSGVWVIAVQHDWKPGWPHSDKILIRTKLDDDKIYTMLQHLGPDTVEEALPIDQEKDLTGASILRSAGERHVVVWWD